MSSNFSTTGEKWEQHNGCKKQESDSRLKTCWFVITETSTAYFCGCSGSRLLLLLDWSAACRKRPPDGSGIKKAWQSLENNTESQSSGGSFLWFQTFYTKNLKKLERTQKRKSMYVPSLSEGPHTMPRSIKSMNWNHWIHVTVTARSLTLSALKRRLCFWLWIPTVTRHTGCLGAYRWLQHLVAVHQVAVILISRLGIHNGDIWNDGNWGQKEKERGKWFFMEAERSGEVFVTDLLDSGLAGCDAKLMVASLKGPQPTLFLARTLYW